ncbi:hypothetical protein BKA70DRAFT_691611 [Coprinopsis sp. MPI-PUGE-AT-0042]|nr:hypothetical protein BKA70DRAFT_691611 [Coprinopsis sp. MPI-PUGE-AT-0042]
MVKLRFTTTFTRHEPSTNVQVPTGIAESQSASLVTLPTELTVYISNFLSIRDAKALRTTCSTLESIVRSRVLGILALTSGDGDEAAVEKLKSLASGPYRNVSCAHTICLAGAWMVYGAVTTTRTVKRGLFRKEIQTTTRIVPDYDAVLVPASTSTQVQPLELLSTILSSATNVSCVRTPISPVWTSRSRAAQTVLVQWMLSAPCLKSLHINTSGDHVHMVLKEGYQLLEAASTRNLNIQWEHPVGHLISLANYIQGFRPPGSETKGDTQVPPPLRITSIRAFGFQFPTSSLECLHHLKSLDLSLGGYHPRFEFWQGDIVASLASFWLALAAGSIQLERISAPFAPTFPRYVQSYHATLKHLRLLPYPWDLGSLETTQVTTQDGAFKFLDYTILSNHIKSLVSLEACLEEESEYGVAWRRDRDGSWAMGGVDVAPLFLYSQLRRLCLPLAVRKSAARDHIPSLIGLVALHLPNIEMLALHVKLDQEPSPRSLGQSSTRWEHALDVLRRAISTYRPPSHKRSLCC